jgi:hypothetical protein
MGQPPYFKTICKTHSICVKLTVHTGVALVLLGTVNITTPFTSAPQENNRFIAKNDVRPL